MHKRIASLSLLALAANLIFGSLAFAEEAETDNSDEYFAENDEVLTTEDASDDAEDAEITEEVTSEEETSDTSEVDGDEDETSDTSDVDPLDEEEVDVETTEEIDDAWTGPSLSDILYVSVRWGFFGDDLGQNTEHIDADGIVHFSGEAVGLPHRYVKWEPRTDQILWRELSRRNTVWNSLIVGYNDGLVFKIKTDLDATGDDEPILKYTNDYIDSTIELPLSELLDANELTYEFDNGFTVVFKTWTNEEWIEAVADHFNVDEDVAQDYEQGAWYVRYMNLVVFRGFFSGYKNLDGIPTGLIGPGDKVTRYQTLKVFMELADDLDMGTGTTDCDPETVELTDEVEWMGSHWAAGYVQCAYDSDMEIYLLDELIGDDLTEGIKPAERWEVATATFDILGLEVDEDAPAAFDDVEDSDIPQEAKDQINTLAEWGIVSGHPDGTFRPYDPVLRAEMFKIVALLEDFLSV